MEITPKSEPFVSLTVDTHNLEYPLHARSTGIEFFLTLPSIITHLAVNVPNATYCLNAALESNPLFLPNIISLTLMTNTADCQTIINHVLHNRPTLERLAIYGDPHRDYKSHVVHVDPLRLPPRLQCLNLLRPISVSFLPRAGQAAPLAQVQLPSSITELGIASKMTPRDFFLCLPPSVTNLSFEMFGTKRKAPSVEDAALLPPSLVTLSCSFDTHAGRCGFFSALPPSLTSLVSLDGPMTRRQFACLPLAVKMGPTPIMISLGENVPNPYTDGDIRVMEYGVERHYSIGTMGSLVGYMVRRREPILPSAIARFASGLLPEAERTPLTTTPPSSGDDDDSLTLAWDAIERLAHCCSIDGAREPRQGRLIRLPRALKRLTIESPRGKPDRWLHPSMCFPTPSTLPYNRESPFDALRWPTTLQSLRTDFYLPPNMLAACAPITSLSSLSELAFVAKTLDESHLSLCYLPNLTRLEIFVREPSDVAMVERFLLNLPPRLAKLQLSVRLCQGETCAPCSSLPESLVGFTRFRLSCDITGLLYVLPHDNDPAWALGQKPV